MIIILLILGFISFISIIGWNETYQENKKLNEYSRLTYIECYQLKQLLAYKSKIIKLLKNELENK